MTYLLALLVSFSAHAQSHNEEVDQAIGTIHKIDMTDDKPKAPNYTLIMFDVKKLKVPGARGYSILRQFAKRVRVEFVGDGVPKGKYALAVAAGCGGGTLSAAAYKSGWKQLHQFDNTSTHISTEKSQTDWALRPGDKGKQILEGKSLGFFRINKDKFELIDCKPVQ